MLDFVTSTNLAIGVAIILVTFIIWRYIDGSKLKPVGHVTGLSIFPVKSTHALQLDEVQCTELGFYEKNIQVYDRSVTLLHSQKKQLTPLYIII